MAWWGALDAIDAEVIAALRDEILRPAVVEVAIGLALEALAPDRQVEDFARVEQELVAVRAECDRLAEAIGSGGPLDALVAWLQARQARRDELAGLLSPAAHRRPCDNRRP